MADGGMVGGNASGRGRGREVGTRKGFFSKFDVAFHVFFLHHEAAVAASFSASSATTKSFGVENL
jgi:hypothetical protein